MGLRTVQDRSCASMELELRMLCLARETSIELLGHVEQSSATDRITILNKLFLNKMPLVDLAGKIPSY